MVAMKSILCLPVFFFVFVSGTMTDTKRLVRSLFDDNDYDKRIRPVYNESTSIYVEMLLFVSSILDMDERKQILKTNLWLTFNWEDEFLRWDPDEFGGLESFKITSDVIWTPDVTLYNSADTYKPYMDGKVVVVKHNGAINWASPAIFYSHCRISVTHFPFDQQQCELKFGPWQHDGSEVILHGKGDASVYTSDGEWDMQSVTVSSKSEMYPDAPGISYYDVTYLIKISRRSNYYVFNLILPCILLSAITTLVFILPADSGEKVSLGITVLLSLTVFLLIIAESMPATSDVPVIGQYYAATMLLVSISVVLTIIVLNLHHGGPYIRPVPNWMRRIILFKLARLLRIDSKAVYSRKRKKVGIVDEDNKTINEAQRNNRSRFLGENDEFDMMEITKLAYLDCPDSPLLSMHRMNGDARGGSRKGSTKPEQTPSLSEDTILLRRLLTQLLFFRERTERSDVTETFLTEWKQVAVVVDRVFMIFYLMLSAATILIIIAQVDMKFTDETETTSVS
ncbi:neuronal acetylcholine receptor subunit alpha-10-like [Apostichopus japonicus]|uniref:neuronal acetylcholine receptor subunit alpha-10-like n=1 Tax=Stichopus japonicus TaxID=307972 RepID=UPI003AB6C190